ncbi:hypothetical protein DPMN_176228 [Dreissena polymorpha]|uniref:Uncharacterized protein n=1 Tax=Dreissena polymorpha TaxID=45954 RepID=A0A9D4E958_DREPO|nr:hypothetical protein DPMN_176228 [Dreissena polymorpha]
MSVEKSLLSSQYSNILEKLLVVHSILKWKWNGNESSFLILDHQNVAWSWLEPAINVS